MQYVAHVVIAHYNNAEAIRETLRVIKERKANNVHFFLIDNGSIRKHLTHIEEILSDNTKNWTVIVRENKNKEAGAYWHYILKGLSVPDVVLFTQDELHQCNKKPKKVPWWQNTRRHPYYPDYYGGDGISIEKCFRWIKNHPYDQIGFGGTRYRENINVDRRWREGYWKKRWKHLNLKYYDFFSGACFALGPKLLESYIKFAKPTEEDLDEQYFAWMWERMWGTIPLYVGGNLIHYSDWSRTRIEWYWPERTLWIRVQRKFRLARSKSRIIDDLSVVKDSKQVAKVEL